MTIKQELFIQKYLENGMNATKAYQDIYPGVSDLVAASCALKLLRKADIKVVIDEYKEKLAKKSGITKERLVANLEYLMDNNLDENPKIAIQAISEINKMLGYLAPTQTENTHTVTEQPLFFGPVFIDSTEIKPKQINE